MFRDAHTDTRTHGRTGQKQYASSHSTLGRGIKTGQFTRTKTGRQGSHTFNDKKFQDLSRTLQDHQNVFPGPYRSPLTFKYEDKQQLHTVHTGCNPMHKVHRKQKLEVLHVVHFEPPVNSSTIQDLHFPVLSRTLRFHFQDFPGPGKSRKNIQDFPGYVGTLGISYYN